MKDKICPHCKGNGFIKLLLEEGRESIVTQCNVCNSQGELDESTLDSIYVDADGIHRLQ